MTPGPGTATREEVERDLRRRVAELSASNEMLWRQLAERDQAEEAVQAERAAQLRESEARFRAVAEGCLDTFFLLTSVRDNIGRIRDFRFVYVNGRAEVLLNLSRSVVLGRSLCEVFPSNGCRGFFEKLTGVVETGQALEEERIMDSPLWQAGRWVRSQVVPLADGVAIICRDITDRRHAEETQRANEERLRTIIQSARFVIFALDRNGIFTFSDGEGLKALGLQPGQVVGQSVFDVYSDAPLILDSARRALAGEAVVSTVEYRGMVFDTRYTPQFDNGQVVGAVGVASDVTEAKRVEEDLRKLRLDLEARVQERTAALAAANKALQTEVQQRGLAEQALRASERVARGQAAALSRTAQALAAEPSTDAVLGLVLRTITEELGGIASTFWLNDHDGRAFVVHMNYARGTIHTGHYDKTPDSTLPQVIPHDNPLGCLLVDLTKPLVINDAPNYPDFAPHRDYLRDNNVGSLIYIPVPHGERVEGLIVTFKAELDAWRPDEVELARTLAYQASLAVQMMRLAEHGRRSAVFEERNRLARDIHDTLAQGFVGVILFLEAARAAIGKPPADPVRPIDDALALARSSLSEARHSVRSLRPPALEGRDLAAALNQLVLHNPSRKAIRIDFHCEGDVRRLPADVEENLLRVAQEALANAIAHARARSIAVALGFEPESVHLSVADDGDGFDPASTRPGAFGLISMRERVERLAGTFTLDTKPGQGTTVSVAVPLPGTRGGLERS